MNYYSKINQFGIILILSVLCLSISTAQTKKLFHVAPPNGVVGEDLILSVSILEIDDPIEAKLYYRLPRGESYLEKDFVNTGFNWQATISGFSLTEEGIEFNYPPQTSPDGKVKVAFCRDPDGTLIEMVEEL